MTRITRKAFLDGLAGRPIKVEDLKSDARLNSLNLDAVDQDANGVIGGDSELNKLFGAVDHFDRDGSYHSMSLEDRLGRLSQAGDMVAAIESHAPERPAGTARPRGRLGQAYHDYRGELASGVDVRSGYTRKLAQATQRAKKRWELIDSVAKRADVPPQLVAAIWYREDGQMRTNRYLHNGQRLGRETTIVPKGIYFREDQFADAAVHALGMKKHLKKSLGLTYESRDLAAMAAYTEAYNGFGYRMGGRPSPYVTAGTDLYSSGLYVRDGVINPHAKDRRVGTLPFMRALMTP